MTAANAKKEMWSIRSSLTTNRSVPTARILTDNGKAIVSQKQKADGFIRLHRDVSNPKFQKHERDTKKVLIIRLMNELVDPDVCLGFSTDEVKAAFRNINPTKASGLDKIHPCFLHHLSLVSFSPLTYLQQIVGGDKSASRMESPSRQP